MALLFSNTLVAFWEEHQAGNEIAALKAKLANDARVLRDGKWATPKASELVAGDVIRLRLGDIVPADARLLDGDPVEVDQSALTGESLPVTRKPGEAVFSGSIMRQGEIDAMVYATGTRTYFGKTAELVQQAHTVSHFQRAVLKIGDYLIVLAVALVAIILAVSLLRHNPVLNTLEFCLVLLVASIPVAMPTVLSVTMAVGARLLAKSQAIVTRLSAIEELAGVDGMATLTPEFSASRSIREYTNDHYLPAATGYNARAANDGKLGGDLLQWQRSIAEQWSTLRFGNVTTETKDGQHRFQIEVVPGGLHPDQFRVELYAGPIQESGAKPEILAACKSSAEPSGTIVYSVCCPAKRPVADYTARLVPSHTGAFVPLEAGQILWQR